MSAPVHLVSHNFPHMKMRHREFRVMITDIASPLDVADASFRVVPGLDGVAGHISFESVNFPGHFIRHSDFHLYVRKHEATPLFAGDASFAMVPGLADPSKVSFISANFPDRHIRHCDYKLELGHGAPGDAVFAADATFQLARA